MAVKLADVYVALTTDDTGLNRGLDQAERKTSAWANVMQGIAQGVGQRLFDALIGGSRRVVSEIGNAIDASSDLNESINKSNVVFGQNAAAILEWSRTSATAFGQSRQQALEAAAGLGNLFVSMGITGEEAADMSREIVELASDLASFNNLSPDEVLTKLRAGLVGETEPLRTLGVNLSAVTVEAKAMELGLAATTKELTEQDKVLARYNLIMEQTALAHGDFANTAQSAANAQRILAAQQEDAAARIGNIFRPAYESVLNLLIELGPTVFSYAENIAAQFANGLASIVRYLTPVLVTIRSVLAYWLAPGSPPRLLPDLTEWGLGAMQAYMEGWTLVDVRSALQGVGRSIENVLRSFVAARRIDQGSLVDRVLGGRDAIARAVREFQTLGRVSSQTMAEIVRAAGPAGAAVAGLVRSYFDLQRASQDVARAQDELNQVTASYQKIIDPLQAQLGANQGAQDAIREELRLAQLREEIADAALDQEQALAAQREINEIRGRLATGGGSWSDRIADQERLLELEGRLRDSANAAEKAELARLEIEEIRLRQQLRGVEAQRDNETDLAQQRVDQAKAAEEAARAQLTAAEAFIEIQAEQNRLLAEQIELNERFERERIQALERLAAEEERIRREREQAAQREQQEADRLARDQAAIDEARFGFEFATADTAGKLELLNQKLAGTEEGSVDYYRTLTQLFQIQQQLNRELEKGATAQDESTREAERAAEAQFAYQFSIADTAEKLELLRQKLAGTQEGTADYYQTLTQIAGLERQYAAELERATDAQFQYQLAVADTPEKIELLKQKLAEAEEGSADYYQTLTQISQLERQYQNQLDSESRQAAAEAERERAKALSESEKALRELEAAQKRAAAETERIADAQFRYQLAIADTPGKIELVKAKLAETEQGTVDYYNLLTQLHTLETQLNKEREATAKGLEGLGKIDLGPPLDANIINPLDESSEAGANLKAAIEEMSKVFTSTEFTAIPGHVKTVADAFSGLVTAGQGMVDAVGPLLEALGIKTKTTSEGMATDLGEFPESMRLTRSDAEREADALAGIIDTLASDIRLITALMRGDWAEFWAELERNSELGRQNLHGGQTHWLEQTRQDLVRWLGETSGDWARWFSERSEAFGRWLADTAQAIGDWASEFKQGGGKLLGSLWDGMKERWSEVRRWFDQRLQELRNMLPFSEPKDPTSPLRNLARSGQAIVESVQAGIERAALNIDPLADSLLARPTALPALAGATSGGNQITFEIAVTIEGNADEGAVRRGVAAGADDIISKMRQMGIT